MQKHYGRYEVMYQLGQGAMAAVHLARDPLLGRFVAIKVLHSELTTQPDVLNRFFKEARIVAAVRHPHVVEVFDFGQEGQSMFLVMEFVDGQSLGSLLKQLKIPSMHPTEPVDQGEEISRATPFLLAEPMDAQVAAALICQAAEGLSVAVRHGVVHRDIKPENMMIDQEGNLKISDFGIAHVQDDSLTKTGAVLGSPHYMSPEQARGFKPITFQADMFSLGAVFYNCLAGHPPFQGKNLPDLFRKIVSEPHVPLWRLRPDIDPFLMSLVDTLLHKDPAQRGGGPKWLHRQLQSYLLTLGIVEPSERVSTYLQGLSAQGVQTTWRSTRSPTVQDHAQRTLRYSRETRRETALAWPLASIVVVAVVVTGLWYRLGHHTVNTKVAFSTAQMTPAISVPIIKDGPELRLPVPAKVHIDTSLSVESKSPTDTENPSTAAIESPANLTLQSSPPFAEVFVDGRYVGLTPVKLEAMISGSHRIVMKGKGSPPLDTLLILHPGVQGFKFIIEKDFATRLAGTAEEVD